MFSQSFLSVSDGVRHKHNSSAKVGSVWVISYEIFLYLFFFFFFCDLSGFSWENVMSRRTLKHLKLLLSGCWVTVNLTGSKFSIADQ